MVNRYNEIIGLNGQFTKLISIGLIPVHIMDWKVFYEAYLMYLKQYKKTEAVKMVEANYPISERNMFRIIQYMESI